MTRAIKFRAWDTVDKMVYFDFNSVDDGNCFAGERNLDLDEVPVMQFTGLLDKNGKEIWEGDIVKNERGEIGQIVFNMGAFVSKYIGEYAWDPMEPCDGLLARQEIIGNVHENPELLEGKQ